MPVMFLMILAVLGLAVSGVPAMVLGGRSHAGAAVAAVLNILANCLGVLGLAAFLATQESPIRLDAEWGLPVGHFAVGVDPLSVVFLLPVFVISALGTVYALGYREGKKQPGSAAAVRFWWGLLAAAMAMVVIARDAVLLLMAWEVMALSAFMLIAAENHKGEVRKAAWNYLVATHVGTLCLFGFFALWRSSAGSFALWDGITTQALPLTGLMILGLVGFGMKAGVFPLHVWLPGAHANAPSHVSAILSGVMLKMGVYGMFRVTGIIAHPPVWLGVVVLGVGMLSALIGIAYATAQQDYKRLLAYSSIENIGIIMMGLGLGLLGQAAGKPAWTVLGIGAALFHVLNHSMFKPLLFMGAGSLLHAVHTRRMDRLGGLAKKMPWTFGLFVVGAVAICGLPPLNGFVSELMLYVGLLWTTQETGGGGALWGWAAIAVPALAAVGAMAVVAFVKLLGAVFMGEERGEGRSHHGEGGASMLVPMVLLAVGCLVLGVVPVVGLKVIVPAVEELAGKKDLPVLGQLPWNKAWWPGAALAAGIGVVLAGLALLMRKRTMGRAGTWDCGYARPTGRMQYTGASYVQMMVDLVSWAIWPKRGRVRLAKIFPGVRVFSMMVPDVVLDRVLLPAFSLGQDVVVSVRGIQKGSVQAYMVYVLVIIVVLVLAS